MEKEEALAKADHIGGIQRMMEVSEVTEDSMMEEAIQLFLRKESTGTHTRVTVAVSRFGMSGEKQKMLLEAIDRLEGIRPVRRTHQHYEKNVSTARLLGEKIIKKGVDLCLLKVGEQHFVGSSIWYQDVDAYAKRDVGKPARDMKVGMLPPKLAQFMVNAVKPHMGGGLLYDPFCGTGTIMMEAALQGYETAGSDISERMVKMTEENMAWLANRMKSDYAWKAYVQDATTLEELPYLRDGTAAVVTEGFLGENFEAIPKKEVYEKSLENVAKVMCGFFKAIAPLSYGIPLCVSLPWYGSYQQPRRLTEVHACLKECGFSYLSLVPSALREEGRLALSGATEEGTILYMRKSQFIGRELICITM